MSRSISPHRYHCELLSPYCYFNTVFKRLLDIRCSKIYSSRGDRNLARWKYRQHSRWLLPIWNVTASSASILQFHQTQALAAVRSRTQFHANNKTNALPSTEHVCLACFEAFLIPALQHPARHEPIRPCFRPVTTSISPAHYLLPTMSPEQTTSPHSTSRVSCCFATTLSFLIIVPTLCLTLALRQNADSEVVYSTNPDFKDPNRTVRLLGYSLIEGANRDGRSFSPLNWPQLIFPTPLCSWGETSMAIPATSIARQLIFLWHVSHLSMVLEKCTT